jgi:hypothetical protein
LTPEETRRLEALQAESAELEQRGALDECVVRVEEMLTFLRGVEEPEPMDVAGCHANLGHLHERLRHWAEAEANYRQAVMVLEGASGAGAVGMRMRQGRWTRRAHRARCQRSTRWPDFWPAAADTPMPKRFFVSNCAS